MSLTPCFSSNSAALAEAEALAEAALPLTSCFLSNSAACFEVAAFARAACANAAGRQAGDS